MTNLHDALQELATLRRQRDEANEILLRVTTSRDEARRERDEARRGRDEMQGLYNRSSAQVFELIRERAEARDTLARLAVQRYDALHERDEARRLLSGVVLQRDELRAKLAQREAPNAPEQTQLPPLKPPPRPVLDPERFAKALRGGAVYTVPEIAVVLEDCARVIQELRWQIIEGAA